MKAEIKYFSDDMLSINLDNCSEKNIFNKTKILLEKIWGKNSKYELDEFLISILLESTVDVIKKTEKTSKLLYKLGYEVFIEKNLQNDIDEFNNRIYEIKENEIAMAEIKNNNYSKTEYDKYQKKLDNLLVIKLRDYQYKSSYLLSSTGYGFEFSVPGSGKTIIAYSSYAYLKSEGIVDRLLIVGPKNSYNAWYEEYITCFGKTPDFINLSDMDTESVRAYLNSSSQNHHEINLINIEKVRNLEKHLNKFVKYGKILFVVDEGHKIKNPNSKSSSAVLKIGENLKYKFLLTGTPMPNGYEDLFALTNFIISEYNVLPFSYLDLKRLTKKSDAEDEEQKIMAAMFPYFSRVSKRFLVEKGELKNPIISRISNIKMDSNQQEIYDFLDGLYDTYKNSVDNEFLISLMKAIVIRKMQVSSNPILLKKKINKVIDDMIYDLVPNINEEENPDSNMIELRIQLEKADGIIMKELNTSALAKKVKQLNNFSNNMKNNRAVEEAIKLIELGKKVIIWDTFVENMYAVANLFKIKVGIINGNVVGSERQSILDEFRNGDLQVLIASPATLAESISLHKTCQHAIYLNRNYNAAQFIQSKDRIHRINMPLGTTAHYIYLMNDGTIDSNIDERLEKKESRMLRILDQNDLSIGDIENSTYSIMTEDDIKSAF